MTHNERAGLQALHDLLGIDGVLCRNDALIARGMIEQVHSRDALRYPSLAELKEKIHERHLMAGEGIVRWISPLVYVQMPSVVRGEGRGI